MSFSLHSAVAWLFIDFRRFFLIAAVSWFVSAPLLAAETPGIELTPEEAAWVAAHRETAFSVGFDPHSGMDVFEFQGKRTGFLPALLDDMQAQLGLRAWIVPDRVQVDATVGHQGGPDRAGTWASIGLRLLSLPFLP